MYILKIGGNELDNPDFLSGLGQAIAAINESVVIVHGGGRAIADLQARLGLETVKVDGLRVTDADSLQVVEMVLSGKSNKQIVRALLAAGVDALGMSGVDRGLLRCNKKRHPTADLGYVGEIDQVRTEVIQQLVELGITPVISPISLGYDGRSYNINADTAAGVLAKAVQAQQIVFVSNVPGVIFDGQVLPALTAVEAQELIAFGVIRDGMRPKVQTALAAVADGIRCARIVNLDGLVNGGGTTIVSQLSQGMVDNLINNSEGAQ